MRIFKDDYIADYNGNIKHIDFKPSVGGIVKCAVGILLMLTGAGITIYNSFKEGAKAYNKAEYDALDSLGLIENNNDEEDAQG